MTSLPPPTYSPLGLFMYRNEPVSGTAMAPCGRVRIGALAATVQTRWVGALVCPPLVACTVNVCVPAASPEYVFGDAQAETAPLSSLHLKSAPLVAEVKLNDAAVSRVDRSGASV